MCVVGVSIRVLSPPSELTLLHRMRSSGQRSSLCMRLYTCDDMVILSCKRRHLYAVYVFFLFLPHNLKTRRV